MASWFSPASRGVGYPCAEIAERQAANSVGAKAVRGWVERFKRCRILRDAFFARMLVVRDAKGALLPTHDGKFAACILREEKNYILAGREARDAGNARRELWRRAAQQLYGDAARRGAVPGLRHIEVGVGPISPSAQAAAFATHFARTMAVADCDISASAMRCRVVARVSHGDAPSATIMAINSFLENVSFISPPAFRLRRRGRC